MKYQTKKELNTSRRKRRKGVFKKAYELWKLCDLDVALFVENPDDGQLHTFLSTKRPSWPPTLDDIVRDFSAHGLQSDTDQVRNSVRVPQPNLCYLKILKSQPSGRIQGQAQDQRVLGEEER